MFWSGWKMLLEGIVSILLSELKRPSIYPPEGAQTIFSLTKSLIKISPFSFSSVNLSFSLKK
jgi:hypothetical protein